MELNKVRCRAVDLWEQDTSHGSGYGDDCSFCGEVAIGCSFCREVAVSVWGVQLSELNYVE